MANRHMMVRAFNVVELALIEDALEQFMKENELSEHISEVCTPLLDDVTFARRMLHQIGKSDHQDR